MAKKYKQKQPSSSPSIGKGSKKKLVAAGGIIILVIFGWLVVLVIRKPTQKIKLSGERTTTQQAEIDSDGQDIEVSLSGFGISQADLEAILSPRKIRFMPGDPVNDYDNFIGMSPGGPIFIQTLGTEGELSEILVGVQVKGDAQANSQSLEIGRAVAGAVDHQIETWVGKEFNYVFENQNKNYEAQETFDQLQAELYFEQTMNYASLSLYLSFRNREPILPRPHLKVDF